MRGKIDIHGKTDVGRRRENNEDQFLIADLNKSMRLHQSSLSLDQSSTVFGGSQGQLFLVADGMGGQAAGEFASRMVVNTITTYMLNTMPWFFRLAADSDEDFVAELKESLQECQRRLRSDMEQHPSHQGMGTTLTMGYLIWPRLYIVHAGDSRCYLRRNNKLELLTRDQTLAQELLDQGALSEDQARHSNWRHVLSSVLGGRDDKLTSVVYRAQLELGDTLLFCTDGLTGEVEEDEISRILGESRTSRAACDELIRRANENGGRDNITLIVSRFVDEMPDELALEAETEVDLDSIDDVEETVVLKGSQPLTEALDPPTSEAGA